MTDTRDLERELREQKLALRETLAEIGDRTGEAVDWRAQYRKHTGVALGAAVVGGLLFGLGSGRRRLRSDAPPTPGAEPGLPHRADRFAPGTVQRSVASLLAVKVVGIAEEAFMQWLRSTLSRSRKRPAESSAND